MNTEMLLHGIDHSGFEPLLLIEKLPSRCWWNNIRLLFYCKAGQVAAAAFDSGWAGLLSRRAAFTPPARGPRSPVSHRREVQRLHWTLGVFQGADLGGSPTCLGTCSAPLHFDSLIQSSNHPSLHFPGRTILCTLLYGSLFQPSLLYLLHISIIYSIPSVLFLFYFPCIYPLNIYVCSPSFTFAVMFWVPLSCFVLPNPVTHYMSLDGTNKNFYVLMYKTQIKDPESQFY